MAFMKDYEEDDVHIRCAYKKENPAKAGFSFCR